MSEERNSSEVSDLAEEAPDSCPRVPEYAICFCIQACSYIMTISNSCIADRRRRTSDIDVFTYTTSSAIFFRIISNDLLVFRSLNTRIHCSTILRGRHGINRMTSTTKTHFHVYVVYWGQNPDYAPSSD